MKLRPALKRFRTQRGLTQQELARLAGVSRQALNEVENGRSVPSTLIALQLARSLGCRVEELFQLDGAEESLRAVLAQPLRGPAGDSLRVVVAQVAGRWVAHRLDPTQRLGDLTLAADAVLVKPGARAGQAAFEPLVDERRLAETLLLAGCDPALGLLTDRAGRDNPGSRNVWLEASSGAALSALARSEVHAAGAHLLEEASGEYNVPFVRSAFAGRAMLLVTVAQIEEGLAVARGNPKRIRGVAQLARKGVRFMNREESAGARRLLDRLLRASGVSAATVDGYDRFAPGHREAAHAVASGAADAAMVTCAVALALGLDFVPLASERFDLAIPKEWIGDRRVTRLLDALASGAFRRELASLGGYSTQRSGAIAAELQ